MRPEENLALTWQDNFLGGHDVKVLWETGWNDRLTPLLLASIAHIVEPRLRALTISAEAAAMHVVTVRIQVLPEHVDAFIAATRANHRGTRDEPGNRRFDLLRAAADATRFLLYEVYADEAGFRAHQQTAHYLRWREAVAPFMAVPRAAETWASVAPEPWA